MYSWICNGETCLGEDCRSSYLGDFESYDDRCTSLTDKDDDYYYCDGDGRLHVRRCDGSAEEDLSDCELGNWCEDYSYSYCDERFYLHDCQDDTMTRYDCGTDYTCSNCVEIDEWIHISHLTCDDDDDGGNYVPACDAGQFYFKPCGAEGEPFTPNKCLSQGCAPSDDDEGGDDDEDSAYPYDCSEHFTCDDDGTLTHYLCRDRGCQDCTVVSTDDNPTCDSQTESDGGTLTLCYDSKVVKKPCSDTDPDGLEIYFPGVECQQTMCDVRHTWKDPQSGKKSSKKHDKSGVWIGVSLGLAVLVLGIGLVYVRVSGSFKKQRQQPDVSSVQMLTKSPMVDPDTASTKPALI